MRSEKLAGSNPATGTNINKFIMYIRDPRFCVLVEWLLCEYPLGEAAKQICEAEVTEMEDGLIQIKYSNGVKDYVTITDGVVVQI